MLLDCYVFLYSTVLQNVLNSYLLGSGNIMSRNKRTTPAPHKRPHTHTLQQNVLLIVVFSAKFLDPFQLGSFQILTTWFA